MQNVEITPSISFRVNCSNAYELHHIIRAHGDGWFMAMHDEELTGDDSKPLFSSPNEIVLAGSKEQLARTLLNWDKVSFEYRKTKKVCCPWPEITQPDMAWHWKKPTTVFGYHWPDGLQDLPGNLTAQEVKELVFPMAVSGLEEVCAVMTSAHLRVFKDRLPSLSVREAIETFAIFPPTRHLGPPTVQFRLDTSRKASATPQKPIATFSEP